MATNSQKPRRVQLRILDIFLAAAITVGLIVYFSNLLALRYGLSMTYIGTSYPGYLQAAWISVYVTTIAYAVGMGIGFLLGWVRSTRAQPLTKVLAARRRDAVAATPTNGGRSEHLFMGAVLWYGFKYSARRAADAYVAIIRGTPLLVQIIFIWSAFLVYTPRTDPFLLALSAGILALTVNTGGYQSEIFRAGIHTVHSGQIEAARAIGLSRLGAMRYVVLPQAIRLVIPPLTNEYIGLLKASSLLISIGSINELTTWGRFQAFHTAHVFEAFALVSGIYLIITVPASKLIDWVERRYRVPGLGIQAIRTARF